MTQATQTEQPTALEDLALWLAQQHQMQQQDIADKTAMGLALLWGLMQFDRLDATTPAWLHAATLQVEQQFRVSEQAAFEFVQGSKWAIEPLSKPLRKVATVFPTKDFQLAMRATGPATVKRATQTAFAAPVSPAAAPLGVIAPEVPQIDVAAVQSDALALGKLTSTGAGVKFALNGGRGEVQQLVVVDAVQRFKNRQAIGWARFTEDSENGPCYFCALLASQGAIYYGGDSFDRSNSKIRDIGSAAPKGVGQRAVQELLDKLNNRPDAKPVVRRAFLGDGPAKVHDHCKCTLRPVYREKDAMDPRAKYFLRQWNKVSKKNKNMGWQDKIKAFRRAYKKPPPYTDRPAVNLDAVRRNRALVAQALGEDSAHVAWWDRQIAAIEAAI